MSSEQRPDLSASLLAAGRREVRSPRAESLEARILTATGYATATAIATSPTLWTRILKVLGAKGIVGVSAVVIAASTAAILHYASSPPKTTRVEAPIVVVNAPVRESTPPVVVVDRHPAVSVEDLPLSAPIATSVAKPPVAHVEETDTVGAQTAAIDHARHTLASGDASGALREIDAFEHKFPDALLAEEIAFLRVQALDRAGRAAEARTSAATFLTQYPSSPYAPRAEQIARSQSKETP
jgi:hypothetical protein